MNWYPSTGVIPTLGLVWPNGIASTSLTMLALGVCIQLALLALRAFRARTRTVSVPSDAFAFADEQEVTQTAA